MERPIWTIIALSNLFPRELSDNVAILILGFATFQATIVNSIFYRTLPLFVIVPSVCLLAALSHDSRKERLELALIAYGSKTWQIHLRYFIRGIIIAGIGSLPTLAYLLTGNIFSIDLILPCVLMVLGAICYALPSLRRMRSLDFVGRYKH